MPAATVSFTMENRKGEYNCDMRRDDYRRQKLTDVEETDEIEGTENRDKVTETSSQHRKTRLFSDASVVLTEDTDCFIIGMKVWVGGTKPGQIAYIGETQFAPGEWAGIVLDDPIGKNDGSVGGIRYFQCEPKRGVFSRLTRLTLAPLMDAGDASSVRSIPTNGTRKSSIASQAESLRSLQRTPLPGMNTSTSSLSYHDLKLGERVIVQSSQGSKAGTLRYVGTTEFAVGEWAGVELDDPMGKNDGSVEGKRYFECQPKFGLFAPVSKVSKSPSSRKPGQCAIHKSSGTPGSGMRRSGSRESMTSMTSTASSVRRVRLGVNSLTPKKTTPNAASTPISKRTLQDVLQEKEHHIEQLLKERETNHAENVESKLKLKQEFEQYRSDYEDKLIKLASQLDDEKKKLEDAVFRFEEELISKGDLEVSNKNNLDKLKKLDDELEFEKSKSLKLERNLEDLRAQHLERQKRSIGHEEEINSLKEQLERAKRHISENDVAQNDLSKSCQEKDAVIERLRNDLNTANKLLKEKCIAQESQVLNELQRTKSEVVEVKLENEKISQEKADLEGEMSQLKKNLEQTKSESNCSETDNEKSYQKQIEELRQQVKESKQQMYDFKKESAKVIVEKDKKIHESEMILSYEKAETERLKGELNQTINELMQNGKLNENRHKRQVEQRQVEISDLYDRFVVSCDQLTTCRILSTQLENEICVKNEMIEKLQLGYSSYSRVIQEQKAYISRIMMQVKAAEMRAAEWQNKFNMAQQTILELEGIKQQLEKEILALGANDHDTELILQDLQNARTLLENLRIETREKLEAAARIEQELRFNLESMTKQFAYEREELLEKLRRANETESAALDACQKSRDESLAHQEQLQLQIAELTKIIESNKIEYSKEIDFAHEKVHELQMLLEKITAEKEKLEHDFNFKYERLTNEIMNLNEVIKEKSELLMIAEEKLHQHLMESNSISGKDKAEFERKINELMMEINNYQRIIQETNINLEKTQIELNDCKTSTFQLEQKIHTQEYKIAELLETNNKCETMYAQTKDMLQRTEMQIQELNLQLKSINDMKTKVENMLSNKNNEIESLNQEINNLQSIRTDSNANILEKEQKIATLVAEIEKLQTQKNTMDSVLVERENKIIALIDQLELLKGQTTDKEIIEKQEKQLIDLKMELQRVTQEKIEVNNALVVKDNQIAELKHILDEKSTYIERVIQEKETEVSLCRQQLSALDEQKNEALNTLHEKEERLISLTNEMHELQTTKMIVEKQLQDHQHDFENLKEQLRVNGNCKEANDAIIKELEIKLAEKEETITILQNDIQNLQAEWQHPTNNPIVSEIMKNLEEKEKLLMEKESQIIILNNEIKQAIAQTQQIQQSWQLSVQQLENQVHQLEHERETSLGKCEGLQKEIVVLTQKLHEASTWEQQLNIQKQKFAEIYVQLTTSEGERNELMNKLQVALTQVPLQHCEPITQVIREVQEKPPLVINDLKEDITHQQIELYQQMHEIKIMLTQKENELLEQRNECSRLQEQLLKAETRVVEVPIPVPGPVQYIETCTQTEGSVQNVPTIPDYKVELEQIQTQLQQTTVQLAEKTQQLILKENECATLQQAPVQKEIVKVPVEVPGPIQYIEKCTQVSKEEKPVNQEEINNLYVQLQQVTIQLTQKEQELMTQKNECEQLQKKVVEKEIVQVPVPVPGPVQYVEKCTNTDFAPEQPTQVHITQEQFNTVYTQLQETASQLVEKEEQLILKQNECNTLQQHIHEKEIVKVPVPVPGPVQVIEKCVGTEETPIPQETVQEITNLHIQLHEANVQLIEQQQQFVLKQNECQNLQEKLIHHKEVVEVPVEVPVPGPVQIVERCTEGVLADTAGKECQADMQQLLEEHSLAVGQVDFLNSIIIDMKRKNEELQARIEILESGHHNGATHQGHDHCHNVIIKKIAAPRKYCDICEIFDAHETEDCPVQMSDADIHQVIKVMDHRNVRPYCEICEVFGHATEDCTMNETY